MKQYIKRIIKAILNKPMYTYTANKEYVFSDLSKDELRGKVALITGGSGSLGGAICFHLAAMGATVYVGGRNLEKINDVVEKINNLNGGGVSIPLPNRSNG